MFESLQHIQESLTETFFHLKVHVDLYSLLALIINNTLSSLWPPAVTLTTYSPDAH